MKPANYFGAHFVASGIAALILMAPIQLAAAPKGIHKPTSEELALRLGGRKQPGAVRAIKKRNALISFNNRFEWHVLPPGVEYDPNSGRLVRGTVPVSAMEFIPDKILWTERGGGAVSTQDRSLICGRNFCGIDDLDDGVLFEFPIDQSKANSVAGIIGLNGDGTYAEVFVGSMVEGEDGDVPGNPREILAWRFPNEFKRLPIPTDGSVVDTFRFREKTP